MKAVLTIPVEAVGKQRPRFSKGHVYTPQKTLDFEEFVRVSYGARPKFEGPVIMEICFGIRIPKGASKRKAEALAGTVCTKKPDIDNLCKSVLDALNGIAYDDDKNIVSIHAVKRWMREPATIIKIMEWDGA